MHTELYRNYSSCNLNRALDGMCHTILFACKLYLYHRFTLFSRLRKLWAAKLIAIEELICLINSAVRISFHNLIKKLHLSTTWLTLAAVSLVILEMLLSILRKLEFGCVLCVISGQLTRCGSSVKAEVICLYYCFCT